MWKFRPTYPLLLGMGVANATYLRYLNNYIGCHNLVFEKLIFLMKEYNGKYNLNTCMLIVGMWIFNFM